AELWEHNQELKLFKYSLDIATHLIGGIEHHTSVGALPVPYIQKLADNFSMFGFNFVPLVHKKLHLEQIRDWYMV
ncbi:MAG: hypothetical protein M3Q33_09740, partial [Acidobacteriota bacterium]|nr:hypothetical protein [Acidobacteriota bacterium]